MTIYYSSFTTTDGKEFLIGYDSGSEGTGDVVSVEVSNSNPTDTPSLQRMFPNTSELVVEVPENEYFLAQN